MLLLESVYISGAALTFGLNGQKIAIESGKVRPKIEGKKAPALVCRGGSDGGMR